MRPDKIETTSFEIIDGFGRAMDFGPREYQVARRMVHAHADPDFFDNVRFGPGAIEAAIKAIKAAKPLIADTKMLIAGTTRLPQAVDRIVKVSDPDTIALAKELGITRSRAAMRLVAPLTAGALVVVGNAPTALHELIDLIEAGQADPACVVGLPVGYVEAAESKDRLAKLDRPFITSLGPKGGSAVAAAAINALALLAEEE